MMPIHKIELASTADSAMSPERALHIGRAVGTNHNKVTVGMDLSKNSRMIRDAFVSGLLSVGSEVFDVGHVPAPVAAMASERSDCCAMIGEPNVYGVMSSISLRNPDGSIFNDPQLRALEKYSVGTPLPKYDSISAIKGSDTVIDDYVGKFVEACGDIDCPVIIDCGCGSTSLVAPQALSAAGADVMSLNSHPDRNYSPRFPGIELSEAKDVQSSVRSMPGSIGILLNGDGTQVALIDEKSKYVTGSQMLALLVKFIEPRKLVVPVDMSSGVDLAFWKGSAETEDRKIIRCEPDPISLTNTMKEEKADLGALGDGTVILPKMTKCPDGMFAAAMLAKYAGTNSLNRTLAAMPKYFTDETKIHCTGSMEALGRKITNAIDEIDYKGFVHSKGWRVDMESGWFLLNYPDKDGVMRIKIESDDKAYAVGLMEMARDIVNVSLRSQ